MATVVAVAVALAVVVTASKFIARVVAVATAFAVVSTSGSTTCVFALAVALARVKTTCSSVSVEPYADPPYVDPPKVSSRGQSEQEFQVHQSCSSLACRYSTRQYRASAGLVLFPS